MSEDPKRRHHEKHPKRDERRGREHDEDSPARRDPRYEDRPMESPRREPNDPREEEIRTRSR